MDLLSELTSLLPPDWDAEDDTTLVCPCGHVIELDGRCPNGHVSPLRENGLI